jgi:ATP-dependent Clp protease ATP-binding subunit ClpX
MSQNNKLFKVLDEYIYFDNALESQEYAKSNPGKTVVRNSDAIEPTVPIQATIKTPKINKSPKMILEYLNKHVISQDEAKKNIALAMYYHSLKSKYSTNEEIGTNGPVMIVGPTGSGKTFIVQKACEYIDTLFLHVDTASMVPEGIKGYSVNSLIQDLIYLADDDIEKASKAVIFLDEVDKLFLKDDSDLNYGARVASQLLRLLEGSTFKVYDSKNTEKESIDFNTENIQFILGGAFQSILDEKQDKKSVMGFNTELTRTDKQKITLEDLYKTDVPKELLGRMNSIVNLYPLNEDDYYKILTQSESSPLNEFINKIMFHGDRVDISDETIKQVSRNASESELGVRAIRQILQSMFNDALFSTSDGDYKTHYITYKEIYDRHNVSTKNNKI